MTSTRCRRTKGGFHHKESARRSCPDCRDAPSPTAQRIAAPPTNTCGAVDNFVTDRDHNPSWLTPGFIDDEAIRVYREGQCLAFASEMAKTLGSDKIVVLVSYENPDAEGLDEATIHHAWALSPDGVSLIDIDETKQTSFVITSALIHRSMTGMRSEALALSTDEALSDVDHLMVEQNYPLAATFAQVRADELREELLNAEPSDGDARITEEGLVSWYSQGQWSRPSELPF